MKPLVSVIVPIYKVEPYLERCLDSLVDQTLKEIEIIVVDDGSPDRCGEICDAYAARDERFRVVHQENRGLSAARNVGIDLARADYLMFVDSDDWVDPDYCRLPYEAAVEHGAELVMFQYVRIKAQQRLVSPKNVEEGVKAKDTAMWMLYHGAGVAVWNKLYAKRLFTDVKFIEGRYFEDHPFQPRAVYAANRIYYFDRVLYYYSPREGSITRLHGYKTAQDHYEMLTDASRFLEEKAYYEEAQRERQAASFHYLVTAGRAETHSADCISYLNGLRLFQRDRTWKRTVMLSLLRYAPSLFDLVCIMRGRRIK